MVLAAAAGMVLAAAASIGMGIAFDGGLHHVLAEPALEVEAKIPLGAVRGRIDHMDVDLKRRRLFVAELGNSSVSVVEVMDRKVVHRITGLEEPQGVGYVPSTDTLYVANAGDGAVRLYRGADYAEEGKIALGRDADNIRVDTARDEVLVGYGEGGLAVIAPKRREKIGDIPLKGHPESFRLHQASGRIFVNVPSTHTIAVIDRSAARQIAAWPMQASANFPMALDEAGGHVVVVFRNPAVIRAFATADGKRTASLTTCGDADDVFIDAKRQRAYVSCGEGFIDVLSTSDGAYRRIDRMATAPGARTSLFVPEWDRLFVAVRGRAGQPASIWVLRPQP
jgi:DNA-binding beta-propeller fold protein YncE